MASLPVTAVPVKRHHLRLATWDMRSERGLSVPLPSGTFILLLPTPPVVVCGWFSCFCVSLLRLLWGNCNLMLSRSSSSVLFIMASFYMRSPHPPPSSSSSSGTCSARIHQPEMELFLYHFVSQTDRLQPSDMSYFGTGFSVGSSSSGSR